MLPVNFPGTCVLLAVCLTTQSTSTLAALGEITTVPVAIKSNASSTAPSFTAAGTTPFVSIRTHEALLGSGTTVKEFATPQGRVFAVSWRGPVLPDFSALLGTHFPTFRQNAESVRDKGVRKSTLALNQDGLVMRSTGRMRAFEGFAYLPALVPDGVVIDELLQ